MDAHFSAKNATLPFDSGHFSVKSVSGVHCELISWIKNMLLLCAEHPIRSLFDTEPLFCFDLIGSQSDWVWCLAETNFTSCKEQKCNQTSSGNQGNQSDIASVFDSYYKHQLYLHLELLGGWMGFFGLPSSGFICCTEGKTNSKSNDLLRSFNKS